MSMSFHQPLREAPRAPLSACIERATLLTDQTVRWGETALRMRYFVGAFQPPLDLVTSIRAVLFRDAEVMVMTDARGSCHVNPGGRREPGESSEDTLRRELIEETGWTIRESKFIGFIHFRHLGPRPDAYPYPYPEFVQLLFVAEAGEHLAPAQLTLEYEVASEFLPIDEAHRLLDTGGAAVLAAATRLRTG